MQYFIGKVRENFLYNFLTFPYRTEEYLIYFELLH